MLSSVGGAQHALRMRERSIMTRSGERSIIIIILYCCPNKNDCLFSLSGYRGGIMLLLRIRSRIFVPDKSLQPRPTGAAGCTQPLSRHRHSYGFGYANNGKAIPIKFLMFCFSDKQELETDQGGRHENKKKLINRRCGLVNREHHQSTDSQLSF